MKHLLLIAIAGILSLSCGCRYLPNVQDRFDIEYFPITGKYYPRHNGCYIWYSEHSGVYHDADLWACDEPRFAVETASDTAAKRIIEIFKEQQLRVNVKVIQVK